MCMPRSPQTCEQQGFPSLCYARCLEFSFLYSFDLQTEGSCGCEPKRSKTIRRHVSDINNPSLSMLLRHMIRSGKTFQTPWEWPSGMGSMCQGRLEPSKSCYHCYDAWSKFSLPMLNLAKSSGSPMSRRDEHGAKILLFRGHNQSRDADGQKRHTQQDGHDIIVGLSPIGDLSDMPLRARTRRQDPVNRRHGLPAG
ncbi:hypothetical protein BV22DRAFT_287098 [Leucogyrophana mollusca]|uniref:Uncharacterized protein n=1 Tax=Leucogyrophana mollusca TaxID=85980 RepID=A0ACB8BN57_9AGAM|nr:hypothetical protein BV22DRAFT_287098 [Leucogyrophana mollusca]